MNERLIQNFIDRAAMAVGKGSKAHALVSIVAEHCAMIADSCAGDEGETDAARTMRAAFVPSLEMKPIAKAAHEATH